MSMYEVTFIFRQDITVSEVNNIIDSFTKSITDGSGEVAKREYWGLRELSYQIRKNKKGHYIMLICSISNRVLQELHKKAKLSEDIIRILSVKIEDFDGADSVIMRSNNEDVKYA